ncbi:MAG: hypothetical protein WCF22_18155 [Candidatus Sulfotelmatobacter sp.]
MAISAPPFPPTPGPGKSGPSSTKKLGGGIGRSNPAFDRSWHGLSVHQGVTFSPDAKFSYDITKKIAGGLEYYGAFGPATDFLPFKYQQQQFFPAIDVDFGPQWEFNFGVGVGATRSTDHLIIKCIIGRRFSWPHGSSAKLRTSPD